MAITIDTITTTNATGVVSPSSFNHTCATGSILAVFVASYQLGGGTGGAASVTYNGVSMTQAFQTNTGGYTVSCFYLSNPTTGSSQSVAVTFSGSISKKIHVYAASFLGVDTVNTLDGDDGNYQTSGTTSFIAVPTTAHANSLIVAIEFLSAQTPIPGSGQTSQATITTNGVSALVTMPTTTAGNQTVAWTSAFSDQGGIAAMGLKVGAVINGNFLAFM